MVRPLLLAEADKDTGTKMVPSSHQANVDTRPRFLSDWRRARVRRFLLDSTCSRDYCAESAPTDPVVAPCRTDPERDD